MSWLVPYATLATGQGCRISADAPITSAVRFDDGHWGAGWRPASPAPRRVTAAIPAASTSAA